MHAQRHPASTVGPLADHLESTCADGSRLLVAAHDDVFPQSDVVNAFNGSTLVASQALANLATNCFSATGTPKVWDFLIDTVTFKQAVGLIFTPPHIDRIPQQRVRAHGVLAAHTPSAASSASM